MNTNRTALAQPAFEIARAQNNATELFITYNGVGRARVISVRKHSTAPWAIRVDLGNTLVASGLASLTLAELDTLVSYSGEPPTLQQQIDALDLRVDALE